MKSYTKKNPYLAYDWSDAFDCCRECNHPIYASVEVLDSDGVRLAKIFPSGRFEPITDDELLEEVFAEIDRECAEDVLTEGAGKETYRRKKTPSESLQGHSRYDEDGDLPAYI